MSNININRRIQNADIIEYRISAQNANNLWNYIAMINKALNNNIINADQSIDIEIHWVVDPHMIDQIVDSYEGEGWTVIMGVQLRSDPAPYSGSTILNFSVT